MDASLLEDTRAIVLAILDYLEQRNLSVLQEAQQVAAAALQAGAACDPQLLQDAQNFDFDTCQYVPSSLCPTAVLPAAVRTTTAELTKAELPYFFMLNPLLFPTAAAVQGREETSAERAVAKAEEAIFASLSAALQSRLRGAWERVSAAPAKEAILHASMDRQDWAPLVEGAPLFQRLSGTYMYCL